MATSKGALQRIVNFLTGASEGVNIALAIKKKEYNMQLRYAVDQVKRTQNPPNLPPGVANKLSKNYYGLTRDNRRDSAPPKLVSQTSTQLKSGDTQLVRRSLIYLCIFYTKIIMDGYISKEDFRRCCYDICKLSTKFQDNFVMQTRKDGDCYMIRKSIKNVTLEKEETILTDFEELTECQLSITSNKFQAVTFEHHVFYSDSFNVPVLYFVAYCHDGSMLSLESIWNLVPNQHQHALHDKWSFLTQQEHPELGCIYYYLHPCHTGALMKNFMSNDGNNKFKNYVLTWLSAVGPIACLDLELEYFK